MNQNETARDQLLALLKRHADNVTDAHEADMVVATLAFVAAEPQCAERSLSMGHLTGSAWIVDRQRRQTLLTHHRKLDKWLQLGGHADGNLDLAEVAMQEAREESGLAKLSRVGCGLFDIDRHLIPARKTDPEHWHYDLRFMVEVDPDESLVISDESNDLRWVEIARMAEFNPEESMMRMARKTLAMPHKR